MALKEYSTFSKGPVSLEPHHQIVLCHVQDIRCGVGSYTSAEVQSVYSTAPADWARKLYSNQLYYARGWEGLINYKYTNKYYWWLFYRIDFKGLYANK